MSGFHLYVAERQPATHYIDDVSPGHRIEFHQPAHALVWCGCCEQKRRAENAVVQIYYDCTLFWCAPGRGCKDPEVIAAKRRREFRNRSLGNRAAWARRKTPAPPSHATK